MSFPNQPARIPSREIGGLKWFFIIVGIGLAMAAVVIGVIVAGISIGEFWGESVR